MRKLLVNNPPEMDFYGKESVNTVCSNLSFAGKEVKRVAFTSCVAGEGKSTTCARVAITMAQRGKKCLLIDADLRRSKVMLSLGIHAADNKKVVGLAHYLAGHSSLESVIYETNIENFYIIPIGRDVVNPLVLIDSPEYEKMMNELTQQFDMIIVDTPPIGLVVDAAELAKHCDGVVMVVEYGKRHKNELIGAVEQLRRSKCRILGCIIDKVIVKSLSEKQYYRSHYYYSGDYGSYGYGEESGKGQKDGTD